MKRGWWLLIVGASLSLAGCVVLGDKIDEFRVRFGTIPYFVFDNAPNYTEPTQPKLLRERVTVAVAVAGGGSRSAVFAAGVLEQLAMIPDPDRPSRSLMDRCELISGVSGGSIAAAYYTLYKPASLSNPQDRAVFFQQFKSNMTLDFLRYTVTHYLSHPWEAGLRYYTRYRFAHTVGNTFDQYLIRGLTFGQLHEREMRREAPVLVVPAVDMDTGQKFIFSNLNVTKNFNFDPGQLARRIRSDVPARDQQALLALASAFPPGLQSCRGFEAIDSDLCNFRIATALLASSGLPIVPGPVSLINYKDGGYVHLVDGGVSDNTGTDALVQYYLSQLAQGRKPGRLVIFNIQASMPVQPYKQGDPHGYVSTIKYGLRANAIGATRGQLQANALLQTQDQITVITLPIYSAPAFQGSQSAREDFGSFNVTESRMHQILEAAQQVVHARHGDILKALGR